jgi:hypothetical protein
MSLELAERSSVGTRLWAAVLARCECVGELRHHAERPWASITFRGTRHRLTIAFRGGFAVDAGKRFVATLPGHDFAIHGQLCADADIIAVDHLWVDGTPELTVTAEILLLEDER